MVFLSLESADFANTFIRSADNQQPYGIIDLAGQCPSFCCGWDSDTSIATNSIVLPGKQVRFCFELLWRSRFRLLLGLDFHHLNHVGVNLQEGGRQFFGIFFVSFERRWVLSVRSCLRIPSRPFLDPVMMVTRSWSSESLRHTACFGKSSS